MTGGNVKGTVRARAIEIPCPRCNQARTMILSGRGVRATLDVPAAVWASYFEGLIDAADVIALSTAA